MYKVTNLKSEEVQTFTSKRQIARMMIQAGITDNSTKTLVKKIQDGAELFDMFKIEEVDNVEDQVDGVNEEEVVEETTEEVNETSDEAVEEENDTATNEEGNQDEDDKLVPLELNGEVTEVPQAVIDRIEEIKEEYSGAINDVIEKAAEDKPKRRGGRGKRIIAYLNDERYDMFDTIKKTAEHFKEKYGLKAMPFNPIMKSTRSKGDEVWEINGDTLKFVFENEDDILTPRQKSSSQKPGDDESSSDENYDWSKTIEEMDEDQLAALEKIVEAENNEGLSNLPKASGK